MAYTLEECRKLKQYNKEDYWKIVKEKGYLPPWLFGCPDFHHDESGKVCHWVSPDPKKELPEGQEIPLEKQHYELEPETTQRDNMQVGWSKMVDQGICNDYWRHYNEWN